MKPEKSTGDQSTVVLVLLPDISMTAIAIATGNHEHKFEYPNLRTTKRF